MFVSCVVVGGWTLTHRTYDEHECCENLLMITFNNCLVKLFIHSSFNVWIESRAALSPCSSMVPPVPVKKLCKRSADVAGALVHLTNYAPSTLSVTQADIT